MDLDFIVEDIFGVYSYKIESKASVCVCHVKNLYMNSLVNGLPHKSRIVFRTAKHIRSTKFQNGSV